MGKSIQRIYMDYQAMKQKADRLDELAAEIESLAGNRVDCHSSAIHSWKGDSGEMCRQKVTKLGNNLRKQAKDLHSTANAIRSAAERQYRLEMALAALVSG